MPRGVVIAVTPDKLFSDACLKELKSFIKESTGEDFDIGVIEVCDKEGDSGIEDGQKLLFIIPTGQMPSEIGKGNCDDPKATKVKFEYEEKPFKYVDNIKIK